ncbi:MAG: hypothetical protein HYV08_05120 [Deltaproteobacteria bacterium]|nr:hypothetical protein [Deltaproteobacteria bacterium]
MTGIRRLVARAVEASWTGRAFRRPWSRVDERALRATGAVLGLFSVVLLAWLFTGRQTPAAPLFARGLGLIGLAAGISLALRPSAWMGAGERRAGGLHPLDLGAALILGLLLAQTLAFVYR